MPYAVQLADASVEAALRRIARAQAGAALSAARGDGDLAPRVHAMRKAVKKLRALLRLVRPVCPEAKAEDRALRDMGRALAALRDAAAQAATAEALAEGLPEPSRAALLAPFRAEAARTREDPAAALAAFAEAMAALRGRADGWRVRGDGWAAIEPGLRATWSDARAALRAARRDPSAERVHAWRKRAKDHWYQARLLREIWPPLLDAHVAAADALGEALGTIHDLDVLAASLEGAALPDPLSAQARARAAARRAALWETAEADGRRLFADRPKALARRWGRWWALRGAGGQAEAG